MFIAPIPARQGTPQARIAVGMHNALQYDLNGAAGAVAPTHRLEVVVSPVNISVTIDPVIAQRARRAVERMLEIGG